MNGNFHFQILYPHIIPMDVVWGILETIYK